MTLLAENSVTKLSVFDAARDLEKEAAAANLKPYQLAKKELSSAARPATGKGPASGAMFCSTWF